MPKHILWFLEYLLASCQILYSNNICPCAQLHWKSSGHPVRISIYNSNHCQSLSTAGAHVHLNGTDYHHSHPLILQCGTTWLPCHAHPIDFNEPGECNHLQWFLDHYTDLVVHNVPLIAQISLEITFLILFFGICFISWGAKYEHPQYYQLVHPLLQLSIFLSLIASFWQYL